MTQTSATEQSIDKNAIRPFQVSFPEEELDRNAQTHRGDAVPEKETVADFSQGVQLAFIQALARYWATDYNWRRCEAQLNSHPQFHHRDRRVGYSLPSRPLKA